MRKLVQWLFGIKPAPWTEGGGWRLEWLSMPKHDLALLVIVAIALAMWGVLWLYRKEGRNLTRPIRLMMGGLRMLVLLGVLAMLLEPVVVFSKTEYVQSNVLVLLDKSQSMDLRDAYVDDGKARRTVEALKLEGLKDLRERSRLSLAQRVMEGALTKKLASNGDRDVKLYDFSGQLWTGSATTKPTNNNDRDTTGIGTAIRQALAAYRGQPVAGIVVISDGQSNSGEMPLKSAEFAGSEGIPLALIEAGTAEGPRNVKLKKLEVSPVVFVRDPSPVRIILESRGMNKQSANVVLERSRDGGAWEEIGRQQVTLEAEGALQTISFDFKEERPARLQMRAKVEDAGPELTLDDNSAVVDVRAIRQKMRVLFIAGSTFPEVEFIRNTLMRDPGMVVSTWLQAADAQYVHPGTLPIKRLPQTQEEIDEYDCVVLYDPDPTLWPPNFGQMLQDFVAKAGGGMVYVAGERVTKQNFDRQEDQAMGWLNLLPVVCEAGLYRSDVTMKLSAREPWKLDITLEGKSDPILQFAPKPEVNEQILANLPGMYWHFPVTRAKPGATVLARHGDPRMRNEQGAHVLLATQLAGPGRTIFVAFDSTYRWRYLDEQYFDGFWARMIDRAGRSKQLGGRYPYSLSTDRTTYKPGSPVTLTARFENVTDRDPGLEALHGEVEVADQPVIPLTLTQSKSDPNVFEAGFVVNKSGPHFVRVWAGEAEMKSQVRAATMQFPVELPNLEYERPGSDFATLQQMAKASLGGAFEMADAEKAADVFKVRRVARVLEDRQEIWNAPMMFGTILSAIFAEWILRKKFRLV
jgi:hypothetical protein